MVLQKIYIHLHPQNRNELEGPHKRPFFIDV
jgi:hypothetical protein